MAFKHRSRNYCQILGMTPTRTGENYISYEPDFSNGAKLIARAIASPIIFRDGQAIHAIRLREKLIEKGA